MRAILTGFSKMFVFWTSLGSDAQRWQNHLPLKRQGYSTINKIKMKTLEWHLVEWAEYGREDGKRLDIPRNTKFLLPPGINYNKKCTQELQYPADNAELRIISFPFDVSSGSIPRNGPLVSLRVQNRLKFLKGNKYS